MSEDREALGTRWIGPATGPSAAVVALLTGIAWTGREELHRIGQAYPALAPATVFAGLIWLGGMVGILRLRGWSRRRAWLARAQARTELPRLRPPTRIERWIAQMPDPLELLFLPLLRTKMGRRLAADWAASGLGRKGSRFLLLLTSAATAGFLLGTRVSGVILGFALAATAPVLPYRWVQGRVEAGERRFSEQVPAALDSLAAGLGAGLSFPGAVGYAVEELGEPITEAMRRLERRLRLGLPVEAALRRLIEEHEEESLALAADGIILQRKLGGDLVHMLQESASLARNRVELEREVQAVTAQGRLSGWVIAGLVPASAGILLATNPQYIDILFQTVPGQLLLVVALVLQLIGWAIISRLIRVEY